MSGDSKLTNPKDAALRQKEIAESEWHIANATVDVSEFIKEFPVGEIVRDTEVFDIEGQPLQLASLWARRPLLIVNGSLSCPPSRRLNAAVNQIAMRYADTLRVIMLYVIEAHPDGDVCPYTGTDWLSQTNENEAVRVRQPRDLFERCRRAAELRNSLGLQVQVVVDSMHNEAWAATGKSPNSALLVSMDGECLISQQWFAPDDLVTSLDQHFQR